MKILSLRKQIKFSFSVSLPPNLIFIFTFQDQAQTSIPQHNIHISPSSFSHRTISYNFFCFLGTLQVCRKAALSTFIPANTDSFLTQIPSENFSTSLKSRHDVATELPNFEILENISLTYTRPQVLHRKGRIAAHLDIFPGVCVVVLSPAGDETLHRQSQPHFLRRSSFYAILSQDRRSECYCKL